MDLQPFLVGTGGGGLVLVLYACGRLVLEWLQERRSGEITSKTASVTDAATANTIILKSLEALQDENTRLQGKVKHLEDEAEKKDAKIADLETRLNAIAVELAALKSKP